MVTAGKINEVRFDAQFMYLRANGKDFKISLSKVSAKLVNASDADRSLYKFSPSGYGIHWPTLDEDLSVENLIKMAE